MNNPQVTSNSADIPSVMDVPSVIDRALGELGRVQPRPGMHDRVLRRLDEASAEDVPRSLLSAAFSGWPRLGFAALGGGCLCAAVVFGSLQHSHAVAAQNRPAPVLVAPVLHPQSGVATAASTHIAAHPAIAPKGSGRSDEHLGAGRATVKAGTHVRGGSGIAVPPVQGLSPVH